MTPRATAQQAVELLKIYQIRRENAAIYELVQRLREEVSDLHDANKSIQQEMTNVQTHSQTCNGTALDHKNKIDKLTSRIASLAHKDDKYNASLIENIRNGSMQHTKLHSAQVQLSSRLDALEAKLENHDKRQIKLRGDVAQQIASLQEQLVQNTKRSPISLTQEQLREHENEFGKLSKRSCNNTPFSRLPDNATDFGTDGTRSETDWTVTGSQRGQDEDGSTFISVPTQPIIPTAKYTEDTLNSNLTPEVVNDEILSTQPDNIDLDEVVDNTDHADGSRTHIDSQESLLMLPFPSAQKDISVYHETVQSQSLDAVTTSFAQDEQFTLSSPLEIDGLFANDHQVQEIAVQREERSPDQLEAASSTSQNLRAVPAPLNAESAPGISTGSNRREKPVTSHNSLMAKEPTITTGAMETAEEKEHSRARTQARKKVPTAPRGAPLRRSQRLLDKSQGHVQYHAVQLTKANACTEVPKEQAPQSDIMQETAFRSETRRVIQERPNKVKNEIKANTSLKSPRIPKLCLIRRDISPEFSLDHIVPPSSPLEQKSTQRHQAAQSVAPKSRPSSTHRPKPSPYKPQPRLLSCKRQVVLLESDQTSNLEVSLPPLSRRTAFEASNSGRNVNISAHRQKRQKVAPAPLVQKPILSTSTEEDHRFERW